MNSQWTRQQIQAARRRPLKPVLEALGYRLSPTGDGNFSVPGPAGEIVVKAHYWVRPDDGAAGNAIDFPVKLQGKSFSEAMRILTETAPCAR